MPVNQACAIVSLTRRGVKQQSRAGTNCGAHRCMADCGVTAFGVARENDLPALQHTTLQIVILNR
jgi:hypothetical protein